MTEEPVDLELIANRFSRLVKELLQGQVRRTCFQPWEVEFLLDLQGCGMTRSRRDEALRRYQRAVVRQLERGELPPVRFSEFTRRQQPRTALISPALCVNHNAPALNPQVPT